MPVCKHKDLVFEPSEHAKEVGYNRLTAKQLRDAAAIGGRAPPDAKDPDPSMFPAPLVLPGDELSWNPDYDGHTFKDWVNGRWRNQVTSSRRTLYLAIAPSVSKDVAYVEDWAKAQIKPKSKSALPRIPRPAAQDILEYLRAFYHPLPVKLLEGLDLEYVAWEPVAGSRDKAARVGLRFGNQVIGVRYRTSNDKFFSGQLNLKDLLDAAIAMLPKDAYALLMLLDHDLYEDEEDDFCCGRAYGGSRVAVVSMARYNPHLDVEHDVDRVHAWPASHCREYVEWHCREEDEPVAKKSKKAAGRVPNDPSSALYAAVQAHSSLAASRSSQALSNLWLGRVCKTASHELGHCFGMDHCVFYACIMQGTAGLPEDARQPPYLCPVCVVKVQHATGADAVERYRAMLAYCQKFSEDKLFCAFAIWLGHRLKELEGHD